MSLQKYPVLQYAVQQGSDLKKIAKQYSLPVGRLDWLEIALINHLKEKNRFFVEVEPLALRNDNGFTALCRERFFIVNDSETEKAEIAAGVVLYINGIPDNETRYRGSEDKIQFYIDNLTGNEEAWILAEDDSIKGLLGFTNFFAEAMLEICNFESSKKDVSNALWDVFKTINKDLWFENIMLLFRKFVEYLNENSGKDLTFMLRAHNFVSKQNWTENTSKKINLPHSMTKQIKNNIKDIKKTIDGSDN